jgi:hypothetical protein
MSWTEIVLLIVVGGGGTIGIIMFALAYIHMFNEIFKDK